MTDMAELQARKKPINLAIVHVDPDAFVAHFTGWLEITSFITALRAGEAVCSRRRRDAEARCEPARQRCGEKRRQ